MGCEVTLFNLPDPSTFVSLIILSTSTSTFVYAAEYSNRENIQRQTLLFGSIVSQGDALRPPPDIFHLRRAALCGRNIASFARRLKYIENF